MIRVNLPKTTITTVFNNNNKTRGLAPTLKHTIKHNYGETMPVFPGQSKMMKLLK